MSAIDGYHTAGRGLDWASAHSQDTRAIDPVGVKTKEIEMRTFASSRCSSVDKGRVSQIHGKFFKSAKPKNYSDDLVDLCITPECKANLTPIQREERREFLRRVKKFELQKWLLKTCDLLELKQDELIALKNQDWDHSIFKNQHLEDYALKAFISGHLNKWEVSDILLYCAYCKTDPSFRKKRKIFRSSGQQNNRSVKILKQSLRQKFSSEQVDAFINSISKHSPKAIFYMIPVRRFSAIQKGYDAENVIDRLRTLVDGFNLFIYEGSKRDYQIVLSPQLTAELYKVKFTKQACMPNPVLGLSVSGQNFKKSAQRDILIPCSFFPGSTPTLADGYNASPLEYYHHDLGYHLYLDSTNPHRKAWIELSNLFELSMKETYIFLLDRECVGYELPAVARCTNSEKFWLHILNREHLEPDAKKKIISHIYKNKERWEKDFQIDMTSLKKLDRSFDYFGRLDQMLLMVNTLEAG